MLRVKVGVDIMGINELNNAIAMKVSLQIELQDEGTNLLVYKDDLLKTIEEHRVLIIVERWDSTA
jgi:hypothetical protein